MKVCAICAVPKDESEFNKHARRKDGLQVQCRECGKEKSKEYYRSNRKAHSKITSARGKRIREKNKERIQNYLLGHPCVDCGESDLIVLEFDHVRDVKVKDVSLMIAQGYSWETIMKEIKKCDVRCANDHRRRTHERRLSVRNSNGQSTALLKRELEVSKSSRADQFSPD